MARIVACRHPVRKTAARMPARRRALAALTLLGALAIAPVPATAQEPPPEQPPPDTNPCNDPLLALRCPDLRMAPPADLRVRQVGAVLRLMASNHIVNDGQGPLELRALRGGPSTVVGAYQVVRSTRGRAVFFPAAGWVYWKAIPGQGHYWKYYRAARFELWTLNPDGTRAQLRRVGPKLSYCFRDLRRVRTYPRSPRHRVFGGCSQDAARRRLRLGVSPGWADIYPAGYHENWISITSLTGCFAFVQRADPMGDLVEAREDNNIGQRVIELPPQHGSVAPRSCPSPR
jgi:hypothetical protein